MMAGTTKQASNAGELLSEDDGDEAGAPGDKIARRQVRQAQHCYIDWTDTTG